MEILERIINVSLFVATLRTTAPATVNLTIEEFTKENLALALYGNHVVGTPGTVTAEPVGGAAPVPGDRYFLAHPKVSSLVVIDSAGTPATLTLGTHYTADTDFGALQFLDTTGFTAPFKASYAYGVATEIGISSEDIMIEEGNTDTAPYGLGTYGSRSTPVAGAAAARVGRKIRAKAQKIAAHMLEVAEEDLEWDIDRFQVKGLPEKVATMKEIAWAAYHGVPEGMEPGLEAVDYYDPPNMTYPFGAYICVVDIDKDTGETKVRRFYALDDCGTRINPMVIEGQVHGGLTEAFGIAMGQEIAYDHLGNVQGASFLDFFLPTAVETPVWETDYTVTPSPHHPIGAKGVGESATVGSPAAYVNAVIDALWQAGVRNIDMPLSPDKVWQALAEAGLAE